MKIINRKFYRDYEEIEIFEVGIALSGAEVKSVRSGQMKIDDAYVKILGSEVYLINAQIPLYKFAQSISYNPTRSRKLLLHKKEILRLKTKMNSAGLTLAPKNCYNKGPLIKLQIALVRGRKELEKRKLEKKRDIKIREKREAKEYINR